MGKIEMNNISIAFSGVKALCNVDFAVSSGEIHALVGANGAGKSTLMKILTGIYRHNTGNITVNKQEFKFKSSRDAHKKGIVTVFQEVDTALVPELSVAENIMMHHIADSKMKLFIDWKYIYQRAEEILSELSIDIKLSKTISELTLSEKQMVLIGRAISQNAKYLLLDEPTAPLSTNKTERLFEIVRNLKKKGLGIVFISHKLDEIFKICETVTVLRNGENAGRYNIDQLNVESIVEKMLGKKLANTYPKEKISIGPKIFEVKNLSGSGGISNVAMNVREGEIVGLVGLVGAGKTELCKLLFGIDKIHQGDIILKGQNITPRTPNQAFQRGLALIPEERRKEGILVEEDVETNITLPTIADYSYGIFINYKRVKDIAKRMITTVNVKTASEKLRLSNLSGGNQQKVAIGKWLPSNAEIFIFDEPTKGVDVGSKSEIYRLIGNLAKNKKGIIYASCEFGEILNLTDRLYVMYNGEIRKELITKETNEKDILFYATGGKDEE